MIMRNCKQQFAKLILERVPTSQSFGIGERQQQFTTSETGTFNMLLENVMEVGSLPRIGIPTTTYDLFRRQMKIRKAICYWSFPTNKNIML